MRNDKRICYFFAVVSLVFTACNLSWWDLRGWNDPILIPGDNLAAKLSWLNNQDNLYGEGGEYIVMVDADASIDPVTLLSKIRITLLGTGGPCVISLSSDGAMFTVEDGVTLVLSGNITLRGRRNNYPSLVHVNKGGTLVMNGGTISGNTGGGVLLMNGGTFTMNGGTISGNTARYGGGVYVDGGGTVNGTVRYGTFTKTGGTIYGYSAGDTVNSNVVRDSSGTVQSDWGHAVYARIDYYSGKRKETTAGPSVNLSFFNTNGGSPIWSGEWDY